MTEGNMKKVSLTEVRALKDKGQLHLSPATTEVNLPDDFWDKATVVERENKKSVHLRLDPEVFQHFKDSADGKGHIKKMQDVLAAFVRAQRNESL